MKSSAAMLKAGMTNIREDCQLQYTNTPVVLARSNLAMHLAAVWRAGADSACCK